MFTLRGFLTRATQYLLCLLDLGLQTLQCVLKFGVGDLIIACLFANRLVSAIVQIGQSFQVQAIVYAHQFGVGVVSEGIPQHKHIEKLA